ARHDLETGWERSDLVAMAHPHVEQPMSLRVHAILDALQQAAVAMGTNFRIAKFPHEPVFNCPAKLRRHGLHAVANAQHRHARAPDGARSTRRVPDGNARWTPGQNDARRRELADEFIRHVERLDLAVNVLLAHAARDELGVLGTKIEDENPGMRPRRVIHVAATRWIAKWRRARTSALACKAELTKNVMPTRQSDGGSRLTCASSGVPINGATTNIMLLMEFSAPIVTPCSRGPTALATMPCSAGPTANE